jgi:hypothetical protein
MWGKKRGEKRRTDLALPTPTPRTRADGPSDPVFERVRARPGCRPFFRGDLHPQVKSSLSRSFVSRVVSFVVDVVVCTEITGRGKTGKSNVDVTRSTPLSGSVEAVEG